MKRIDEQNISLIRDSQRSTFYRSKVPKTLVSHMLPNLFKVTFFPSFYSGGQLKRTGNVYFCASTTTDCIKTNNIPLKRSMIFLPEMKKNSNFSTNV